MGNLDFWRGGQVIPKSLLDEVWGVFDDFDRGLSPARTRREQENKLSAACDVVETEKAYVLNFDAPGLKKEDIHIETNGRQLIVSGERKREQNTKTENTFRTERSYGKFHRTFELPEGTNTETIEAQYENGELKISVPKAATTKSRKIEIGEANKGFLSSITGKKEANKTATA